MSWLRYAAAAVGGVIVLGMLAVAGLASISSQKPHGFYLTRAGEGLTMALTSQTGQKPQPGLELHRTGAPMPPLALNGIDGRPMTVTYRPGRRTVVNFWATWCAPCIVEMPELDRAARQGRVDVVGVSMDEDPAKVRAFLLKRPVGYRIGIATLLGPASLMASLGGHSGQMPFSVLVDEHGRIIRKHLGGFEPGDLDRWVR